MPVTEFGFAHRTFFGGTGRVVTSSGTLRTPSRRCCGRWRCRSITPAAGKRCRRASKDDGADRRSAVPVPGWLRCAGAASPGRSGPRNGWRFGAMRGLLQVRLSVYFLPGDRQIRQESQEFCGLVLFVRADRSTVHIRGWTVAGVAVAPRVATRSAASRRPRSPQSLRSFLTRTTKRCGEVSPRDQSVQVFRHHLGKYWLIAQASARTCGLSSAFINAWREASIRRHWPNEAC